MTTRHGHGMDMYMGHRSQVIILVGKGHGRGLVELLLEALLVRLVDDELRWLQCRLLHKLKVCVPGAKKQQNKNKKRVMHRVVIPKIGSGKAGRRASGRQMTHHDTLFDWSIWACA